MDPPPGAHDVLELLAAHATCREFTGERLSDEQVDQLVATAQRAATDATGQLYTLIHVRDDALRDEIARLSGDQAQVREAGAFFAVCVDVHRMARLLEHRGERYGMGPGIAMLFGITDAALAAQNLVVAAEASGYGTCFIGALQNHVLEVVDLLELPHGVMPLWGLCIGVPARRRDPKPRLPVDLVLMRDRYEPLSDEQLDRAFAVMAPATRSGDWLNPLKKYFAEGGHMAQREATWERLLARQGLRP